VRRITPYERELARFLAEREKLSKRIEQIYLKRKLTSKDIIELRYLFRLRRQLELIYIKRLRFLRELHQRQVEARRRGR